MKENGFLKFVCTTACILVLIGAINWGLVGFFGFDLVAYLFGEFTLASRTVYSIVGISAVIFAICKIICMKNEEM